MRTTLTLEPDVSARLEQELRRTGKGMKVVVNEALRIGLGVTARPAPVRRFEVQAFDLGFKPGIDQDRLNQLVDELETEEMVRKLSRDPA